MNDTDSAAEKTEPQVIQVFDGSTISDPIPTINLADGRLGGKAQSRFSRFKRLNAKPQGQAFRGGSMTITWFNSLRLRDTVNLDFPESLLMITESGSTVGKYYCSVKRSLLNEEQCILVHFGSCSNMPDGLECGISVTGFVDENLQTIQEYTHEWMTLHGKSVERKFVLMREQDKNQYFCKDTVWENGKVRDEKNFAVDLVEMNHVISESANVILQRVMIQQKKTGQIELRALTARGDVVRCSFRALGDGFENIRGEEMQVRGLRRTIFDGKNVEEWDSIFNEHGRMVLRCQPDKDHALIPLWFKPVEKYSNTGEFIGTRPPLVWACDMEMYAQYIERKDLLVSQHKDYLMRHPAVKALLADFLQALLQKKPKKVVEFGMQFFEPFLHNQPVLDLCLSDTDSDATVDEFQVIYQEPKWEEPEKKEEEGENEAENEENEEGSGIGMNMSQLDVLSTFAPGGGENQSGQVQDQGNVGDQMWNQNQQYEQYPAGQMEGQMIDQGQMVDPNQITQDYNYYPDANQMQQPYESQGTQATDPNQQGYPPNDYQPNDFQSNY